MAEAAALPLVSITAWEGLIDRANVQPGQRVLVYGATGGVGAGDRESGVATSVIWG